MEPKTPIARSFSRIADISADAWDALHDGVNPFVSHAFLNLLETCRAVGGESGWVPQYQTIWDNDRLVGVAPAYEKHHSMGEYVFDQAWADAYARVGGDYYPKLQIAVPFTPVPGPRLLASDDDSKLALLNALRGVASDQNQSGVHITFCDWATAKLGAQGGYLHRCGVQYHFQNRGYANFAAFLDGLTSRKRKNIRRERQKVADSGLTIITKTGSALSADDMLTMYAFYDNTIHRKWSYGYLPASFFTGLLDVMADKLVLVIAYDGDVPVAGALNFLGGDALYGRYWGANARYEFLHFELCYYRAMDFAIEHGLARVEAGAQGEHKLLRGYEPVLTHSLHWLRDPRMMDAVERFLDEERAAMAARKDALATFTPFKRDAD